MEITLNNEKNGIEIRFESKPGTDMIENMKQNGFRWSNKQKMWYAKQTDSRIKFAESLGECKVSSSAGVDLWELTRTDYIEDNFAKYKIYDNKEIAAIIRKHLRSRFNMCKWSVRSDYNSISVEMLCGPWSKDSDEIAAIAHYAYKFAQSYNYDNSDIMTDYFDVNFYGVHESHIVPWNYEQREMTVEEMNISKRFQQSKAAWEAEEAERCEREYRESIAKMKAERIEAERIRVETEAKVKRIEAEAVVQDADFFVLNCLEPDTRKESSVSGYDDSKFTRTKCSVSRAVYMDEEIYDLFSNLLMADYSFLNQKGGTRTDDLRVNSDADYANMSREERETVEWYSYDCVAIYCDGKLKLVVDPQGFSYARYVFFVDGESAVVNDYCGSTGISEEEDSKYSNLADDLEDVSTAVIEENGLFKTWDNVDFPRYKSALIKWIETNQFPFSVKVVRAIRENEALKSAMYRVLEEYNGIQEQFRRADFEMDQKITMVRISDFGGVTVTRGKFKGVANTSYAQYKTAVKLFLQPENKRQDYSAILYRDVLIYDGYISIPENVLFEVTTQDIGGTSVVCKKSKYLSHDRQQYVDILDYLASDGKEPIVNTTGCYPTEK